MSLKVRLALMAGASLAAVLGVTGADAQTCSPTAASVTGSGSGADVVTCLAGTFATGITYSSNGDLTVSMAANGATVNTTLTANGVNLTGNGADSVIFNSTVGGLTGGAGTAGPVVDITTNTGDITVTQAAAIAGNQPGTTYGIYANSTGGGDITISRSAGGATNSAVGGEAAIAAITAGGNIGVTANGGFTTGRLRGILAQTSGTGTISITVGNNVTANATDGVAAIDVIAGSGATSININAGTVQGGSGVAIRSVSNAVVSVQNAGTIGGAVDFSGVTVGGVTINGGNWNAGALASTFSAVADTVNVEAGSLSSGGSINFGAGNDAFRLNNFFTISGSVSLGSGADTFTVAGPVTLNNTISFGAGADTASVIGDFTIAGGTLDFGDDNDAMNSSALLTTSAATFNFGSGVDVFNQNDVFLAGGLTTIGNLEIFNNNGEIFLGGRDVFGEYRTDGAADDRMVMSSGVFTGGAGSRIALDAKLDSHPSQVGCAAATVSDCANFTGAATAGSTVLTVQDSSFDVNGGSLNTVVTLVEGSTAAEHFTLDPASTYYQETAIGPAIRKPVVAYYFRYDDTNHRHVLIGAPTDEPFQVGTFAASAQETWRATTGSWLTRQADLRAMPGGLEASRGVWGRIGAQSGERELVTSYSTNGVSLTYDLGQKQRIAHMTVGADLVGGAGWVVGGMVGFARSDVEFDTSPTEAVASGFTGGVYASYVTGPLFVDATANANILHIKADAPQMGLGLDVPMKFDLKSLGGQVEAGWRIPLGSLFVEPLAGVSYVVTRIDDTEVPGGSGLFEFEESKSLRLGAGARVGADAELMGMSASYGLTGRYWNESEGEAGATVVTASGSSAALGDEFTGGFSEVAASLGLYSPGGGVSGFVNFGGKFADGYQAIDGSAGVRVRW